MSITIVHTRSPEEANDPKFVEPITTANRPDYPAYPYEKIWTLATFLVALMVWRVAKTFVDDSFRHGRD